MPLPEPVSSLAQAPVLGPPPVKVSDSVLFHMAGAVNLGHTGPQDRPAVVLEVVDALRGVLDLQVFLKPGEAAHGRLQAHMSLVPWSEEKKQGTWRLA